jgi:hypothetical protein
MMTLKQSWHLGIFVIKENIKIMINGPYYLKNCWVAKKVYEKQKEKPKKMLNFIFYDVLVCEICS